MKKINLVFLMLMALTYYSKGQSQMIVNEPTGLVYFDGFGKKIDSLKEIPKNIRDSAQIILKKHLGDFSTDLRFGYGQIIDLDGYQKSKGGSSINPLIPKYDLIYILENESIGFKSYPVELRLSKDGILLKLDWPRQGYVNKAVFLPLDSVKNVALARAKVLKFNLNNFKVEFSYEYDLQKFLWTFLFLKPHNGTSKHYNSITINWANIKDVDVTEIHRVTYY